MPRSHSAVLQQGVGTSCFIKACLPSAASMPAAANMAVVSGSSVALTPPTTAPLPVFAASSRAA